MILRFKTQGTVDNNLGPDSLTGPNPLEPNQCRQSTLLHDICLEVLSVLDSYACYGQRYSPYSYY